MTLASAGVASAAERGVPPEVRAMAQRLAAATTNGADSCSADGRGVMPMSYSATGAAAGAILAGGNVAPLGGGLWVQCSLPYTNGAAGNDCNGKHVIDYTVWNASPAAKIVTEVMALDENGVLVDSTLAEKGDPLQLASRTKGAFHFKKTGAGLQVHAPVPMVRVTVEDQGEKAVAYCTNVPYLDVIEPSGGVATDSTGGAVDVVAAVPLTSPTALHIFVDGDDLLTDVPTPLGCTFLSPCTGSANINGTPVTYANLIIDIASTVQGMSANLVKVSLAGLPCGGHIVRVGSSKLPGSIRDKPGGNCNVDDLTDKGGASVFDIQLTELGGKSGADLVPGLITTQVPTSVKGLICSGTDILNANVNGKVLDVSSQTKITGNGETSGDVVTYIIDTSLGQTNLKDDFAGATTELGTFAPGSNRLLIAATELAGTRAYERLMFAVGDNIKPLGVASAPLIKNDALQAQVTEGLQQAVQARMQAKMQPLLAASDTTIKNAFVVGLSADGAQTILDNLCTSPNGDGQTLRDIFNQAVGEALDDWPISHPLQTFPFEPPCACDTTVPIYVSSWSVGDSFSCPITFEDGQMKVSLVLPNVQITLRADKDESCFANETHVHAFITAELQNIHFDYTLTEADLKNGTTTVGADPFTVGGKVQLDGDADIDYGTLGDICDFFVEGFVTVFTFGQVDIGPLLEPDISFSTAIDVTEALKPAKPDAIPIKGFNIDQQVNNQYHQQLSGEINAVSDVHITGPTGPGNTGAGITVGLKGTFATTSIDASVEQNPGFQAKEPPLPTMASMQGQGAKDALIGLSQDSINMMFQSLGANGDMRVPGADAQGCFPLGATVGSLLPADCESIDLDPAGNTDDVANAGARGYCHAIKGDNCGTLTFAGNADVNLTATERGICYGASGATCGEVFNGDLVLFGACSLTPNFNLHASQNLMFCATADIPRMEFPTVGGSAATVPTDLQINDISVSLVLDRGTDNVPNNTVDGTLATLPGCFAGIQTTSDCNLFSACLDVNMKFSMNTLQPGNSVCEGGKPGFQAAFNGLTPVFRKIGEVCGGASSPTTDQQVLDDASNQEAVTEPIGQNAAFFAPPICGTGLEVPNLFTCDSVAILGLEAGIDPDFKEFLALTCDIH
jgi:hypothetical protein